MTIGTCVLPFKNFLRVAGVRVKNWINLKQVLILVYIIQFGEAFEIYWLNIYIKLLEYYKNII